LGVVLDQFLVGFPYILANSLLPIERAELLSFIPERKIILLTTDQRSVLQSLMEGLGWHHAHVDDVVLDTDMFELEGLNDSPPSYV
jgi:hypothetical protein